ncbi:MAG TPA: family 43 glycosylhydrolase [Actinomycetota bacterium]|nr:family 43 glycosylhydrolase [Actinomycetota bacterium]
MTAVVRGALAAAMAVVMAAPPVPTAGAAPDGATYVNPVSRDFADTFADPAVIRGKDGYWYAYGTSDPLHEGEGVRHFLPVARSDDLVEWDYVGDAFTQSTLPDWAAPDASLWAPDIRYFDGRYYLYYVVTQTTVTDEPDDNAIGVATAPTPTGPWTDSGGPLVGPRRGPGGAGDFKWTFDPAPFTDADGTRYLYYGSYYGGVFVTRLSDDGLRAVGEPVMVAIDNRYEGSYVIRRGRHYYLFASSANCCAGPTTGYGVYVGRATSPLGPFVDREGQPLLASRTGGTIVLAQNGNKWVGPGHVAVTTDLAGRDWLVYHAIDRADPFLDEPFGVNERPMLFDPLDWIDGWPVVRAGRGPSETPQPAPDGVFDVGGEFDDGLGGWERGRGWHPAGPSPWARRDARTCRTHYLVTADDAPRRVRAEGDLRVFGDGAAAVVAAYRGPDDLVAGWIDARAGAFVLEARRDGVSEKVVEPLPDDFTYDEWHNVALEVAGRRVRGEVTDARLYDAVADARLRVGERVGAGAVGAAARCAPAEADNLGGTRLHREVRDVVAPPELGAVDPAYSDDFDGGELEPEWSWVRDPAGHLAGNSYVWPTQSADLHTDSNNASVLLRDAPGGAYTVETKLTIDLGTDTVRNYQQAGLVAYAHDDLYVKLVHVAIWNTRATEFAKEMPFADGISYGGTLGGPPADTTWLRLSHRVDPDNGEHEYRLGTSRDGQTWIWGAVWTLPADTDPRIGLVSFGGQGATAQFDYFRVTRP